jgi:hypothetical protein
LMENIFASTECDSGRVFGEGRKEASFFDSFLGREFL